MILQALNHYYHRLAADPEAQAAPPGYQWKAIRFIVELDPEGRFVGLTDTTSGEGKQARPRSFLVPIEEKKTVSIKANLLWDNPMYVFGLDLKGKPEKAINAHEAFKKKLEELLEKTQDPGVAAVLAFLRSDRAELAEHQSWPDLVDSGANVSFKLAGEVGLICHRPAVEALLTQADEVAAGGEMGVCLITGRIAPLTRLHPAIRGVWGAQTSGANIVSFNLRAFCSQGKTQSYNAPVGQAAAFAYATALNALLVKGSAQRFQAGDATAVCWAEKSSILEKNLGRLLDQELPPEPADLATQDKDAQELRALFKAVETGAPALLSDPTRFYVLGLSPNASRLAVRFWHPGTVGQVAQAVGQHWADLAIIHRPGQPDHPALFRLLRTLAAQGKAENIPPELAGQVTAAVLGGTPYPSTLLQAALRRLRAGEQVNYERAALIKAYLVRHQRFYHRQGKEVGVSLDLTNRNVGYLLGRLFAVLERIQLIALGKDINRTIRDSFYGAASATPVTVYPHLMKLKNHHLSKIENRWEVNRNEQLIGEIVDAIVDIPSHLTMPDQARFAVGYYHQRQVFFPNPRKDQPQEPAEAGKGE